MYCKKVYVIFLNSFSFPVFCPGYRCGCRHFWDCALLLQWWPRPVRPNYFHTFTQKSKQTHNCLCFSVIWPLASCLPRIHPLILLFHSSASIEHKHLLFSIVYFFAAVTLIILVVYYSLFTFCYWKNKSLNATVFIFNYTHDNADLWVLVWSLWFNVFFPDTTLNINMMVKILQN